MIKLAAFNASGGSRIKLRLAGTKNPPGGLYALNVEHRTSNIERRILMALRFIDFETSESQNFKGGFALRGVGATTTTSRRLCTAFF